MQYINAAIQNYTGHKLLRKFGGPIRFHDLKDCEKIGPRTVYLVAFEKIIVKTQKMQPKNFFIQPYYGLKFLKKI